MSISVSGPMFESAKQSIWRSIHGRGGAHYNAFACRDEDGMTALRKMFPKAQADEMNVCLFSTSGIHGTHHTIEDAEDALVKGDEPIAITFLILHPHLVCTRHGNCRPETDDDFAFLKMLRATSLNALGRIGG